VAITALESGLLGQLWSACGGSPAQLMRVAITGQSRLESRYPVAELATASVAAAGLAIAEYAGEAEISVDRELAGAWFGLTLRPDGWSTPRIWDDLAADYRCADGWIRLHTNDPRHRAAALRVLGIGDSAGTGPAIVADAVRRWPGAELEAAVVEAGGCAAELRSPGAWASHPQGVALAAEPLLRRELREASPPARGLVNRAADAGPLTGVQVLDLTRVLAGPAATRLLAGFGATVLRIDPLDRDEPALETEMTLGKACARLDLRADQGRLFELLAGADVLVHGYRPGALDRLGLDEATRRRCRPGLVEVSLDAYGWTGPWAGRRGFDSLVQLSSGIAYPGEDLSLRPTPLPVQALDHATGYLMAAAVARGLTERRELGHGSSAWASLARTAALLSQPAAALPATSGEPSPTSSAPRARREHAEQTFWGPAWRLSSPVTVGGRPAVWRTPAKPFGSAEARWPSD
jgi:hypothetical protein